MVSQIAAKIISAENFIRSTSPPTTSDTVMAAKVIWKAMKTNSGISNPSEKVAAVESAVVLARNRLPQLTNALPSGPKAVE